ncbi:MAG TPA: polysaccharide biosynthesis C-terminal domain-containing protein, partial [Anaerolineaceae bacterium]|nr:polysaccharide biosynthesis C-terminal domain-containing protein [Anaerolineaceae bacterium]
IFAISALLLQLMAASLLFRAVTSVLGRVLLASGRERTLLSILLLETGACLGLAFALIPRWGVLGAALAGLIVTLIDLILHLPPIFKLLGPLPLGRAAWKAVNASLVLIVWLVFATGTALSPWLGILVSLLLYPAVWLALAVLEAGGWRKFLAGFALR